MNMANEKKAQLDWRNCNEHGEWQYLDYQIEKFGI
jgi:hypothetical protein